jgi:hypothetical protein
VRLDKIALPPGKTLPNTTFNNRRAVSVENDRIRVTVTQEGGHVAEMLDKQSGVNPLWIPPWPSIEPSEYSAVKFPEYGGDVDGRLIAGIFGHNLCLDIFGGPSTEEWAAGLDPHGEGSIVPYDLVESGTSLLVRATFPLAAIRFERRLDLHGANVRFLESVENLTGIDRPIGWTQHVTLGPPFVERGATEFRASAAESMVFPGEFSPADYLRTGAAFTWPNAPRKDGSMCDLRVFNGAAVSGAYTAHLMSPRHEYAFFNAYSPSLKVAIGYVWKQADFPWMGIWEENCSRTHAPWNGKTITRAMEIGVSPFPESRRAMVERGKLFGVPTYRWLPAKGRLTVEYWASVRTEELNPGSMTWPAS